MSNNVRWLQQCNRLHRQPLTSCCVAPSAGWGLGTPGSGYGKDRGHPGWGVELGKWGDLVLDAGAGILERTAKGMVLMQGGCVQRCQVIEWKLGKKQLRLIEWKLSTAYRGTWTHNPSRFKVSLSFLSFF